LGGVVKVVLVTGRAKATWAEADEAARLLSSCYGPPDEVVAVNDSGCDQPRVDHWVSFHGDKFDRWIEIRTARGYQRVKNLWTSTYGRLESVYERRLGALGVNRVRYTGGGSSGLVATIISLVHLSATHVVLAGVPLDPEEGHYNSAGPWKEAVKHRSAWESQREHLMPRVRSMGGWTSAVLGKPDLAWLSETHEVKEIPLS